MTARRDVLLTLLLISTGSAVAAESSETLLAHARESSFTVTVPPGWKVQWKVESGRVEGGKRGGRVFELVPVSPNIKDQSLTIYASFYRNVVPSAARKQWEGPFSSQTTELEPLEGLPKWMLVLLDSKQDRLKTLTAYAPLGWDTLYIWFSTSNDALYDQGKRALIEVLKSYKEDKVFAGP